jgi:glycosyltransferase involved in cell wall biosynthesis
MVTRAVNMKIIDGALFSYAKQTYGNKELVVVTDCDPSRLDDLVNLLNNYKDENIKLVHQKEKLRMGALRNLSIEHASGEYCIQWDDDDLYHEERIEKQFFHLTSGNYDYCLLSEFMMYFCNTHLLSTNRWSIHNDIEGNPSSIMFRKNMKYRYPGDVQFGEDVAIAFCKHLKKCLLSGMPYLYVYIYHGGNSYEYEHYLKLHYSTNTPFDRGSFENVVPLLNYMGMDCRF